MLIMIEPANGALPLTVDSVTLAPAGAPKKSSISWGGYSHSAP
jgi:hypothetical protein